MLNLDTHVLVEVFEKRIAPTAARVLKADPEWSISAIVLWEIGKLRQRSRLNFGLDFPPFVEALKQIHIWPVDQRVCSSVASLDFEGDPGDELIAATSLVHQIPLVTRDRRLRNSKVIRCL